jgi:hypothetical protein
MPLQSNQMDNQSRKRAKGWNLKYKGKRSGKILISDILNRVNSVGEINRHAIVESKAATHAYV